MNFDIGVYGDGHSNYREKRMRKDFSSIRFLEEYIEQHKNKVKQKI